MAMLEVAGLRVRLEPEGPWLLDDVHLTVEPGETVGFVGESGGGKTLTALALLHLLPAARPRLEGKVYFQGRCLLPAPARQRRSIRGWGIGLALQDASTALDPTVSLGHQVRAALPHARRQDDEEADEEAERTRVLDLLRAVGLPDARERAWIPPHHLSGGMRKRGQVALLLAAEPSLLVVDEPTRGLDACTRVKFVQRLVREQQRPDRSLLLITHDLALTADTCRRLVVIHGGQTMEQGPTHRLLTRPAHPCTRFLLAHHPSRPRVPAQRPDSQKPQEERVAPTAGCRFRALCARSRPRCQQRPEARPAGDDHLVWCHHPLEER